MIIFKDENYIICKKPTGVSSQKSPDGKDMLNLLSEKTGILPTEIHPLHRLDNPVGGTMIYAIGSRNASVLSKIISENKLSKRYLAVIHGEPESNKDILKDLLFKDSSKNKSFVVKRVRKGVKEASLEYEILGTVCHEGEKISLVKILLHTGRTHQIRVQFSHRKFPLLVIDDMAAAKTNATLHYGLTNCLLSPLLITKKKHIPRCRIFKTSHGTYLTKHYLTYPRTDFTNKNAKTTSPRIFSCKYFIF